MIYYEELSLYVWILNYKFGSSKKRVWIEPKFRHEWYYWKKPAKGRSGESTNWKQCWVLESDKTSGSHGLVGSQTKRVSDPCWSGRSPADHSIPIHKKRNKAEEPPPGYDLKMPCCCPARIILLLNWRSEFNFQKFLSFLFWGGKKITFISYLFILFNPEG